ncbi:unnamed protein product [Auanema sp. JU1783]|nr:unnamed protein product [Auanema sp. JU1783]
MDWKEKRVVEKSDRSPDYGASFKILIKAARGKKLRRRRTKKTKKRCGNVVSGQPEVLARCLKHRCVT